jgi:CRP/FNR family transcriptional regulator, dissimilatory nitrate respiration regulator
MSVWLLARPAVGLVFARTFGNRYTKQPLGVSSSVDAANEIQFIPLFEGLPSDQLEAVASIAVFKNLRRGEAIFSEGDAGNGLYAVTGGRIKIYRLSPDGKEQVFHIFGPGEPFGEVALFEGRSFPANAVALEKSRVVFFPRNAFVRLISDTPSLALNMLGLFSIRLRKFAALVDNLSLREVPGRLAAHILYLSERDHGRDQVELDVPKGLLAGMIGTIPETLSRILGRMAKQGFIATDGPRIRIIDREGLQHLADGLAKLT